ncbi:MAG: glycerol kinase 5 [Candidatus Hodarchaeales archaeon]|jgi:glycerol kinase
MSFILSIDSGSTGIRAVLFNKEGMIVAREYEKTLASYPRVGWIEHDPEVLWQSLLSVIRKLFQKHDISPRDIAAMGIANQRASFTMWERKTGKTITNFINWADVRAAETCKMMNKKKTWLILKNLAKIAVSLTRNLRFLNLITFLTIVSMTKFTTDHVSVRLKWVLDNNYGLRERCKTGEIALGTIDAWFIYKLTGGKVHATDYSNAATGLLDPVNLNWSKTLFWLFDFPKEILPTIKDTNGDFGVTDPSLFGGAEIPIRTAVGDQQAALFGQACFEAGDVKISQGSGAFVDMNVGNKAKLSKRGLFPLVAWVINSRPTYLLEGFVATAGTLIDWLGYGIGLSDTAAILNEHAAKCQDTGGVIVIPTPTGIRFPHFNPDTRATILGLSLNTRKEHVARAVFEGIALRIVDIITGLEKDTKTPIRTLKTDGGVSKSDIMLQCIADFADLEVRRAPEPDMAATGVAYLAGLSVNFWNINDLKLIDKSLKTKTFHPLMDQQVRQEKIRCWRRALQAILQIN